METKIGGLNEEGDQRAGKRKEYGEGQLTLIYTMQLKMQQLKRWCYTGTNVYGSSQPFFKKVNSTTI